jgi:hypothetical protein
VTPSFPRNASNCVTTETPSFSPWPLSMPERSATSTLHSSSCNLESGGRGESDSSRTRRRVRPPHSKSASTGTAAVSGMLKMTLLQSTPHRQALLISASSLTLVLCGGAGTRVGALCGLSGAECPDKSRWGATRIALVGSRSNIPQLVGPYFFACGTQQTGTLVDLPSTTSARGRCGGRGGGGVSVPQTRRLQFQACLSIQWTAWVSFLVKSVPYRWLIQTVRALKRRVATWLDSVQILWRDEGRRTPQ